MSKEAFKSSVYTQRPPYTNYDAPHKFMEIESIVGKQLMEHPHAICFFSGGSDGDILTDIVERVRTQIFPKLPPVDYAFFNTGLEMEAIKRHVKETEARYGIKIDTHRPKRNMVLATRDIGLPFVSKIVSAGLDGVQRKQIPLTIADEYAAAEDKIAKLAELNARYPKCESEINFLCGCNSKGKPRPHIQLVINGSADMIDFIKKTPIPFKRMAKCCDICKKEVAHRIQKEYGMVITSERGFEGGMRSVPRTDSSSMCFTETANSTYTLRPLYYVTDEDKAWYKEHYNIHFSDAYEVYELTRTGWCGCPISSRAVANLKKLLWIRYGNMNRN